MPKDFQPVTSAVDTTRLRPAIRELPADLDTPVSVYLKLAGDRPSFLLESVTGGEQVARYSFIGVNPAKTFIIRGRTVEVVSAEGNKIQPLSEGVDPLAFLKAELGRYELELDQDLPRFTGGLIGYLGYETIQSFESRVPIHAGSSIPDSIFFLTDTLVAFDHAFRRLLLITFEEVNSETSTDGIEANARLDELEARLASAVPSSPGLSAMPRAQTFSANFTEESFIEAVHSAKEGIKAGEIFQVVLSQKLSRTTSANPFDIYRALRRLNPSPYMFFLNFGTLAFPEPLQLIGASPEMHVRLDGRKASIRPIAGTRPRGRDQSEDQALAEDLFADPKERAEHVMLLDLARNDLGRVCSYGSVQVSEKMTVERYSHVMHIVSQVDGELEEAEDAFSLMRATFPAGTVSGAPKIRAMQIIHTLEDEPRGPYAGAVGYFSFDGSMDTCITIRTLVMTGDSVCVHAGAGIVADSDPEREYQETLNKARALGASVDLAEDHPIKRRPNQENQNAARDR
jgi:anthranilate synthase component 1